MTISLKELRQLILEVKGENKYFLYPRSEEDYLLETIEVVDEKKSSEQNGK